MNQQFKNSKEKNYPIPHLPDPLILVFLYRSDTYIIHLQTVVSTLKLNDFRKQFKELW